MHAKFMTRAEFWWSRRNNAVVNIHAMHCMPSIAPISLCASISINVSNARAKHRTKRHLAVSLLRKQQIRPLGLLQKLSKFNEINACFQYLIRYRNQVFSQKRKNCSILAGRVQSTRVYWFYFILDDLKDFSLNMWIWWKRCAYFHVYEGRWMYGSRFFIKLLLCITINYHCCEKMT